MDMQAEAVGGPMLDPERLRYVTQNFESLKGLYWVLIGGLFFLAQLDLFRWIQLLVYLLFFAAFRYVRKYYEQRFGWIEPRPQSNRSAIVFGVIIVLMLFGGFFEGIAAVAFASDSLHLLISDPAHRVDLFNLVWVFVATLFRPGRMWNSSKAMFVCAGLLIWYVFFVYCPYQYPNVTHFTTWKMLNSGWYSISFMAVGLWNHITLVRLLPHRFVEHNDDE